MKIFDTHVHYNLEPILDDWERYWQAAQNCGVAKAAVIGTNLETSRQAVALAAKKPEALIASIGLHPENAEAWLRESDGDLEAATTKMREDVAQLQQLSQKATFAAWGEIGLDFFRLNHEGKPWELTRQLQVAVLREQLNLARGSGKAVIFHVRDDEQFYDLPEGAQQTLLSLISELDYTNEPMIFHCFSGSRAYLEKVLALPRSMVSFAGNVTFKSAHQLRELAALVPAKRLLVETDSPFLAPEPKRGQFCQPAFIVHTARLLSEKCGADLAQVYQNSLAIFGQSEV